jgi:biotin transport system ATP-binding protein|nr:ABC transporter ATP-binding protein [uncultured Limnohabitans sp.]
MHHLQTKRPCIALEQVTLVRGSTVVLHDVSLTLGTQRIGLIGDNGAGKSSLFRLICGLDLPQSGQVHVPHTADQAAPAVGMMFQNPDDQIIFPTVEEELALSLRHLRLSRVDAQAHVRTWLAARGLAEWAPRAIGSLSQGQRQHVCWLALLIGDHQTLLLDEPYSSLDLPGQALLRQEITAAQQQVIVSTHVLDHVRHFERVIWLDKGHVRADGLGEEVCAQYEADVATRVA